MAEDYVLDVESEDRPVYDEAYFRYRIKNERAFAVFSYRMGFSDGIRHSMEETTNKFGITRECVRQIESKAFRPHGYIKRSKKLKDFLND